MPWVTEIIALNTTCLGRALDLSPSSTRLPVQQQYSFALFEQRLGQLLCSQILAT